MAAGNTFSQIASTTLGSAAASVTFSSIAGTYTDLVLVMSLGASTNADNVLMQFNGDTAGNYSSTELSGNGTTASSTRVSSASSINLTNRIGTTTTLSGLVIICNVMNYANATTYKTQVNRASQAGDTYPGASAAVGLWRNTAAITSILIKQSGSPNFITGSTFNLYGITAA